MRRRDIYRYIFISVRRDVLSPDVISDRLFYIYDHYVPEYQTIVTKSGSTIDKHKAGRLGNVDRFCIMVHSVIKYSDHSSYPT